jgi:hypothetical protein
VTTHDLGHGIHGAPQAVTHLVRWAAAEVGEVPPVVADDVSAGDDLAQDRRAVAGGDGLADDAEHGRHLVTREHVEQGARRGAVRAVVDREPARPRGRVGARR